MQHLNLDTLSERRAALCKNFAEETAKHEKMINMFPKNTLSPNMKTRHHEVYNVNMAFTERYQNSAVPQLQRMLNQNIINEEINDPY